MRLKLKIRINKAKNPKLAKACGSNTFTSWFNRPLITIYLENFKFKPDVSITKVWKYINEFILIEYICWSLRCKENEYKGLCEFPNKSYYKCPIDDIFHNTKRRK